MKLNYKEKPLDEAGTAVAGCGTIHQSEIKETLTRLSDELEMPFDFNDYVLGSVGKKEYSGDIDLVVDDAWWGHGPEPFRENLIEIYGQNSVKKYGAMVHLKCPIVGFNPKFHDALPRTGFVQVDFMFGNAEWERFYHFSPGDKSGYKGAHRNLAIAAITFATNTIDSAEKDSNDRPVEQIRWKWSPKGLMYVKRISKKDKRSNVWMKAQDETILKGPYRDPEVIAKTLFPKDGKPGDLDSLETIMDAVKRNFKKFDQESIWKRMASNFSDWRDGKLFLYPAEISAYFEPNDK